MKKQHDFTQGPILPALLKFALPVLLALLLQAMYGAVGREASPQALLCLRIAKVVSLNSSIKSTAA